MMMSRKPSDYTPSYGVSNKVKDNPIPSHFIERCIKTGEVRRSSNDETLVTLRYEEAADHIELRVDLESNEVFDLESSYERDWQQAAD